MHEGVHQEGRFVRCHRHRLTLPSAAPSSLVLSSASTPVCPDASVPCEMAEACKPEQKGVKKYHLNGPYMHPTSHLVHAPTGQYHM